MKNSKRGYDNRKRRVIRYERDNGFFKQDKLGRD